MAIACQLLLQISNDSPGQRWRQLIIPDQEGSTNLLMKICFDSGDKDKCLTISSSSNLEFHDVSLQPCMDRYYEQTWVINKYGHIVNMVTGSQLLALSPITQQMMVNGGFWFQSKWRPFPWYPSQASGLYYCKSKTAEVSSYMPNTDYQIKGGQTVTVLHNVTSNN